MFLRSHEVDGSIQKYRKSVMDTFSHLRITWCDVQGHMTTSLHFKKATLHLDGGGDRISFEKKNKTAVFKANVLRLDPPSSVVAC